MGWRKSAAPRIELWLKRGLFTLAQDEAHATHTSSAVRDSPNIPLWRLKLKFRETSIWLSPLATTLLLADSPC